MRNSPPRSRKRLEHVTPMGAFRTSTTVTMILVRSESDVEMIEMMSKNADQKRRLRNWALAERHVPCACACCAAAHLAQELGGRGDFMRYQPKELGFSWVSCLG
jgi:hypothetical protein